MLPHSVDGFQLRFTGRRSWKARWLLHNRTLDIVPVTWTRGWNAQGIFLEVWYRSAEELKQRAADQNAFVVALARAKNYREFPHAFEQFVGLFRVIPTGIVLSENSIETKVLERVRAKEIGITGS
jgi:hypothetical protein